MSKIILNSSILSLLIILIKLVDAKEIDSKTDLLQEESSAGELYAEHRALPGSVKGGKPTTSLIPPAGGGNELWPLGRNESPQIKNINVKCEKNHMKVNIEFDRPFYGMIFSKGHYSDTKCVHLAPGTGQLVTSFDIFLGACGMTSSDQATFGTGRPGSGLYIENTIIIQYDPQVQEAWDQARRLRCTWYDFYEKSVTFRPFDVDMMDAVTANFLGDNIQCWMQIQAGKGPWASEVTGIVKIGQTMTMVLAIKDDENKFDMLVRNCVAHDGKHQPIQLVDDYGCVVRPKIMSRFQKVKNFGSSATVVSYSYFQAFKFPDSMNVHFQCVIQVCRYECPEPKCSGSIAGSEQPFPTQIKGGGGSDSINPRDPSLISVSPSTILETDESSIHGDRVPVPSTASSSSVSSSNHLLDPTKMTILKMPTGYPIGSYPPDMFLNRQGDGLTINDYSSTPNSPANITSSYASLASLNGANNKKKLVNVSSIGGMPRSTFTTNLNADYSRRNRQRTRRQAASSSSSASSPPRYADIKTEKIIRVVAPGDVSFNLPTSNEEGSINSTVLDVLSNETSEPVSLLCI
uniref:ZP domain-containing protein n=1 Tax=Tetranychus urticae TaxID=32264 RepID=T1K5Y4_TETUR